MFSQSKCKVDAEAMFRLPNNSLPAIAILTFTIADIQSSQPQPSRARREGRATCEDAMTISNKRTSMCACCNSVWTSSRLQKQSIPFASYMPLKSSAFMPVNLSSHSSYQSGLGSGSEVERVVWDHFSPHRVLASSD